jgi:hypothetical protein
VTATSAVSLHHAEKVTADIRCLEKLIDRYLEVTISLVYLVYLVCAYLSCTTREKRSSASPTTDPAFHSDANPDPQHCFRIFVVS